MGQYYYILTREEGKNHVVYNRDLIIDGKKRIRHGKAYGTLVVGKSNGKRNQRKNL